MGQRRRRWANNKPAMVQRLVLLVLVDIFHSFEAGIAEADNVLIMIDSNLLIQ